MSATSASSASSPAAWAAARRSACPGLVRVVAALDGGLCRVRLPGGVLLTAQAHAIAEAALAHANGTLELTNRANLQVRGIRTGSAAALTAALVEAGLGPSNSGSESADLCAADELRNLMLSPLAGLDRAALIDTTQLAAPIVAMLQGEPRFAALSPKFALLIDGGERLAALDHPHDIWLAAVAHDDGVRFMFGLAGCPADGALGSIAAADVIAFIQALLHAFLDLAQPGQTRMREIVAAHGAHAVLQRAQDHAPIAVAHENEHKHRWHRPEVDLALRLGAHESKHGTVYIGCQPPLARLDAATLHALATLAQQHGDGTLRLTPWQGAILPNIDNGSAQDVLESLQALGLIADAAHPLARTIACTGSAGCAKSRADTKADALRLATQLPPDVHVHLSGCERSCAAAHRAPFTLLAVAPGEYDLYEQGDENNHPRAADMAPFGRVVARHLTIEAAAQMLTQLTAQRPRSTPDV
ncbi:precorrin-3B synthase [Burkholderia sp. Ax-1719]|nr:precorrin-3B synthase [Burkholderia sp. Ax-1719]